MSEFIDEPFDEEERQLMEAVENGQTRSLPPEEVERIRTAVMKAALSRKRPDDEAAERAAEIAATKGISLRVRDADLNGFKERAKKAGLPYQTLMNSVLHRYLTGELVPRESL